MRKIMKLINILATIIIVMLAMSCEDEKTIVKPIVECDEGDYACYLIGTWIRLPDEYYKYADTIEFTEDFKVKKHFFFDDWCYEFSVGIIGKDSIRIDTLYFDENDSRGRWLLQFLSNEEVIFHGFDRRATASVKEMNYIKVGQ